MPRAIGRLGASACTMQSHFVQLSLVRTWRITTKLAGTYSNTSETSSPNLRSSPWHCGQTVSFGSCRRVCRGRWPGNAWRAGFVTVGVEEAVTGGGAGASGSGSLRFDSNSSSRNSNCSICRSSFSDLRPNCMRCSLASSNFRCSISRSREISCSSLAMSCVCCARISARSASAGRTFRSGSATTDMRGVSHERARFHPRARKKSCAKNLAGYTDSCGSLRPLRPPPVDAFQQHR